MPSTPFMQDLRNTYGTIIQSYHSQFGDDTVVVDVEHIHSFIKDMKNTYKFKQVMDITAVDFPERPLRFEVVYHLLDLDNNRRLRIKTNTNEEIPVPSIVDIYLAADWWEREVFDLFGITFSNHPDMRRILTDYGFEGYPLRKDFPTTGHVEVIYDAEQKKVVYVPVDLKQSMREYIYNNPWEGNTKSLLDTVAKKED